jgi:hypothetical protein
VRTRLGVPELDGGILSAAGKRTSIGGKVRHSMLSVNQLVQSKAPLSMSHSLMLPSQLPVASVRPSGLKARARTVSVCACQARCKIVPSSRHTRASPRLLPAAQYCPLWLMATAQVISHEVLAPDCPGDSQQGLVKDRLTQAGLGKRGILHLEPVQKRPANGEPRQVQAAQVPTKHS